MPQVSLQQLLTASWGKLEDNQLMYTQSEMTWIINEAIRLGNLFCAWYTKTIPIYNDGATVAGRHIYRVPDEIIIPEKVVYEGKELDKVGLFQLGRNWPTFLKDTTATTGGPVARWCPYSLTNFILHPADAVGGGFVEVTGISTPETLTNLTDTVTVPKNAISMIAEYAAHTAQCKLAGKPLTDSMTQFKTYQEYIKKQTVWLKYRQPSIWFDLRQPE